MSQELTKEQEQFMKDTAAHQKEQVEGLAYKVLALSLAADIPVFDLPYYILQRSRQMVQEAFKSVSFENKKLIKARKVFLKECLAAMKDGLKPKDKVEEKDDTAKRDNRCEPIAFELAKMLLDESLVFSDDNFFKAVLKNEESVPLSAAVEGYMGSLDDKLLMVISEHYRLANKKLWGAEKENVTFKALDVILKKD